MNMQPIKSPTRSVQVSFDHAAKFITYCAKKAFTQ